ncbi:hypothetical protein H4582DRAFT_2171895 [Lactarius indigo]|nr:hypothetical protein H4582DRAFT_2171895 [Lactarius indigo]
MGFTKSIARICVMGSGLHIPTPTGAVIIPRDSAPGSGSGDLWVARVISGSVVAAREDALFLFHINWQRSPVGPHGGGSLLDHSTPFFHLAGLCAHLHTTRVEDPIIAPKSASPDAGGCEKNASKDVVSETPDVAAHWQTLLTALPLVQTLCLHCSGPACVSVLSVLASSASTLRPDLQKILVIQNTVRYATAQPDGAIL